MTLKRVLPYLSLLLLFCSYSLQKDEETFTPRRPHKAKNAYFQETFEDLSNWVVTKDPEYQGTWQLKKPHAPYDAVNLESLKLVNASQRHGISAVFPKVLDNTNKKLIVQYEVTSNYKWECGGAYIKLFTYNESSPFDPKTLNGNTPYTIMFGPDKCGTTSPSIHFIFRHVNPVNGEIEEKHLKPKPQSISDELTHLYTLIVNPDNSFQILFDRKEVSSGSLLVDFSPSVNPRKEVDDPTDIKPTDWVDEKEILDPTAKKPEDWVEEATYPDPEAVKPEDWDDEEDGDWEPPHIPNPNYRGEWVHPKIPNPDYKGEWRPRQIPNPNYFEDLHPHNFQKMTAVGFELWTIDGFINFGNILITSDEDEAKEWADVWEERHTRETEIKANRFKKSTFEKYFEMISDFTSENPIVVGAAGGLSILAILLVVITRGGSKPQPIDKKKKEDDEDANEKVEKIEEEKTEEESGKQTTKKRKAKKE